MPIHDGAGVPIPSTGVPVSIVGGSNGSNNLGVVTANPPTRTVTRKRVAISSSGDNTIITAPAAGNRICYELLKYVNNSDSAITALVKFGASDTEYDTTPLPANGDGYVEDARPGFVALPAATALVINLDVAKAVTGQVRYWVEAV